MAKSLYVLDMITTKCNILSKHEKEQVGRLALFVGVYFGKWFLQCGLASTVPYRTINTFEQMLNFSEFDIELAFTVMDSMRRHTWYLTQQWVVVCLEEEERKGVATALVNLYQASLIFL